MAAFNIQTWDDTNDRAKRTPSDTNDWAFQSVTIGADALPISETDANTFNFGGKILGNVADPVANQDAATKFYVDNATGTGATRALDNLLSVAINTSLLPQDNAVTIDLGSTAFRFKDLYALTAKDASGNVEVDFANRLLKSGATTKLDWSGTDLNINTRKITNVQNPSSAQDAATKNYVDAVATGLTPKASVQVATTAALPAVTYANGTAGVGATLTATSFGALVVDGHTVVNGDRILVKNQASGFQNGIYVQTTLGTGGVDFVLTRATDADTCQPASNPKVTSGIHMFIEQGATYANQGWVLTTIDPITLGTTALVFSQFSAMSFIAGNGIDITGTTISVFLNGTTLFVDGSGLRVNDAGITPTQLDTSVAGNGITGGAGSPLSVVVNADATLVVDAFGVGLNAYEGYINDEGGSILVGQVVCINSNGHVTLATKTTTDNTAQLGIVRDSTIATTATGNIYTQEGIKLGGYTGLTPGQPCYVGTAGAMVQTTAGFVAGNFLYRVGYAIDATTIRFEPEFLIEW